MDNILQDIIRSEEEAARLEEEARQKSLEMLTEARKKAEEILEKSLVEGESMVDELLQKARTEALDDHKLKDAYPNEEALKRLGAKLDTAVDFIVGRVVNKSWQW